MTVALDFIHWIEQVPVNGVIAFPQARAAKKIAAKALELGKVHGRITLWLWRVKGKKMAFAMSRVGGDGGDKPVNTVLAAPPINDADKAELVYLAERN